MVPGVLSTNMNNTDPAPQSVTVQPDEQCDNISHSEQVILAHTFLSDELLATDSLVPRTVPRLSITSENSAGIIKPSGGQFTPIYFGTSLQRDPVLSVRDFFYRLSVFTRLPCRR